MKICVEQLCGFRASLADGHPCKIKDVYFDDVSWQVRYLVVDVQRWLPGKKVLLAPEAVANLDEAGKTIDFKLTSEDVEQAPHAGEKLPMSRSRQVLLHEYFGWHQFWLGQKTSSDELAPSSPPPSLWQGYGSQDSLPQEVQSLIEDRGILDMNLQSCHDLKSYYLKSADTGEAPLRPLGRLSDFVLDHHDWHLSYLVIDAKIESFSRRRLVPTILVQSINNGLDLCYIFAHESAIARAPNYEDPSHFGPRAEEALRRHYRAELEDYMRDQSPQVREEIQTRLTKGALVAGRSHQNMSHARTLDQPPLS